MKFYPYLLSALVTGSLFILPSCKKDDPDKEAPVIVSVTEPADGDTLMAGSELHVEVNITDNEALSQLKLDIHSAEDGHSHGKVAANAYWEQIVLIDLSGTSQTIHEHVEIPATVAAGHYHVIVTAVDQAGNVSEFVERDIVIRNPDDLVAPVISITAPANNTSIAAGTAFQLQAGITDNGILSKLEVTASNGSTSVLDWDAETGDVATYTLDQSFSTNGWAAGNYTLKIKAFDSVLNESESSITLILN